jgi:hypothetical protein
MAAYTWAGFYPAQFNTPLGSAIVAPGRVVEWPDGPPNEGHGWVESPDEEPTPFEELATQEESSSDSAENTPAAETTAVVEPVDTAGDEKPADPVSTQVTDTDAGDTTDQTEPEPATSKRSSRTTR